jgi:23S rRNA (adenine2503-C2)-methyltransferase
VCEHSRKPGPNGGRPGSSHLPHPGTEWDASPLPVQEEFVARVRAAGVAYTVRDTRGHEIVAACGQRAASQQ